MKFIKFKETNCNEDNLVLLHQNCENCGAPLKLNKENMTCKCNYCNTEYYVKNDEMLGYTLVGQLIIIKIRGEEKNFYISEEQIHSIYRDSKRDLQERLVETKIATKEILKLIEV